MINDNDTRSIYNFVISDNDTRNWYIQHPVTKSKFSTISYNKKAALEYLDKYRISTPLKSKKEINSEEKLIVK